MAGSRSIKNFLRYRKVVRNPWTAAMADRRGAPETQVELVLRRGGSVWVRAGTSDMLVFREIFLKDVYGLAEIGRGASRGSGPVLETVVDVGGHIGLFSIGASSLARRVVACEPVSSNAALFRRNVLGTGCTNVTLEACAVTSTPGTAVVHQSRNPAGHTVLRHAKPRSADAVEAPARTLAEIFAAHAIERCSLLKVDCEGGEYDILLNGGEDLLRRIDRIALEYHPASTEDPRFTSAELDRVLAGAGFRTALRPAKGQPEYGMMHAWREAALQASVAPT